MASRFALVILALTHGRSEGVRRTVRIAIALKETLVLSQASGLVSVLFHIRQLVVKTPLHLPKALVRMIPFPVRGSGIFTQIAPASLTASSSAAAEPPPTTPLLLLLGGWIVVDVAEHILFQLRRSPR